MLPPPKPILVVASECEMRTVLRLWLEKRGFTVHEASDLESAMQAIFRWPNLAAVICDQRLPDGGALNFLHWMREQLFAVPFLLITGRPQMLQKRGRGFDVIATPVTGATLREALSRLVDVDLFDPSADSEIPERSGKPPKTGARRKSGAA
jgi:DNA-binding NtrC family response regulator